jgi:peptide deformylase
MNNDDIILYDTKEEARFTKPETKKLPVFDLVSINSPVLYSKLEEFDFTKPPVNPNEFASSLVETCKKFNGIGLSANQCGFPYRVFVMGAGEEYIACFNPKVISTEEETHMEEGCLSFPLLVLKITRPKKITVEYQDFTGEKRTTTFEGITARCFLHELDHMDGIVYTTRVKPLALEFGMKKMKKLGNKIHKAIKSGKIKPEDVFK